MMSLNDFKKEILPLKVKMYRYVLSLVHREELAKDIIQEVFLRVWEKRDTMHMIKNKKAWCLKCASNLAMDKLKSHGNKVSELTLVSGLHDLEQRPYEVAESRDLILQMQQILEFLPADQRDIFRLRELAGYNNQEIGEILGISPGQVKVYLHRARQKIRTSLEQRINYGISKS
ncbi:MAG: RNA polymerase sigma factor [Saprospiraceae bacterium]|nr:RNA polymerase sigma factor [Saprospiraceae bacterium]